MKRPLAVIVAAAGPVWTRAVHDMFAAGPFECQTLAFRDVVLAAPGATPGADLVLVAPQSWLELAGWLPHLRGTVGHLPWVLLADLRLIGMFLYSLQDQPCGLVDSAATPDDLWAAMMALANARYCCLRDELIAAFVRGASTSWNGRRLRLPTPVEVQCGCAVSLGLSNRQIAEVLHLQEVTVKSHLYRLMRKLDLDNRHDLGTLFQQALSSSSATFSRQ